jgi:hypothetical protein
MTHALHGQLKPPVQVTEVLLTTKHYKAAHGPCWHAWLSVRFNCGGHRDIVSTFEGQNPFQTAAISLCIVAATSRLGQNPFDAL